MDDTEYATRIGHKELRRFSSDALNAVELSREHADIVADAVVDASLRGIDTHGIVRLEPYVEALRKGGINSNPELSVFQSGAGAAVVDGDDGPGQVTTLRAMQKAMELADDAGSAFVGVRNSNHFGTASYYTNYAAEHDYIGIAMTHASPNVAPFGGVDPYLGTNPLSFSLPNTEFPVTLDMATSVTSKGSILLAEDEGKSIPSEWAIDEEGNPTTDPEDFHALRPMAGPKGYGLAFMIDALCGVLLDTSFGEDVTGMYESITSPQRVGHLVCAIDVNAFTDLDGFTSRMRRMATEMKDIRTADDVDEILLPGEPEAQTKDERLEAGIPITESLLRSLQSVADSNDIELA